MKRFKGTKGEWNVWKDDIVITEDKVEDDVICVRPQIKASQKNWEANAKLIASAPQLLEALLSIENDNGSIPEAIWDLRNKAISKALD